MLASSSSCGYRFAAPNSKLPQGITRVQVPVFNNRTAEPGADALFTEALREHLFRAGRLGDASSGATIEGELTGVSSGVLAASPGRLPNYRLNASLTLVLKKNGALVARADVAGGEDFPAGADVLWAETYRAAALRRLAESLTREGLEQLATGW